MVCVAGEALIKAVLRIGVQAAEHIVRRPVAAADLVLIARLGREGDAAHGGARLRGRGGRGLRGLGDLIIDAGRLARYAELRRVFARRRRGRGALGVRRAVAADIADIGHGERRAGGRVEGGEAVNRGRGAACAAVGLQLGLHERQLDGERAAVRAVRIFAGGAEVRAGSGVVPLVDVGVRAQLRFIARRRGLVVCVAGEALIKAVLRIGVQAAEDVFRRPVAAADLVLIARLGRECDAAHGGARRRGRGGRVLRGLGDRHADDVRDRRGGGLAQRRGDDAEVVFRRAGALACGDGVCLFRRAGDGRGGQGAV